MSNSYREKVEQAETGDINAMKYLADAYRYGFDDCEINPEKALFWIRKLSEAGDGAAMFELALYYGKANGKIHNIKSYLLTALFNAGSTMSSYYKAMVNHDMPQFVG